MSRYFPLFVSLEGKKITVIGGGNIAARRVEKLLPFSPEITVIAPVLDSRLFTLWEQGKLFWHRRPYQTGDCAGAFLVLAATDDENVNRAAWQEAREHQIPVNTADRKERCDFYFPGLVVTEEMVVGVTANGDDHTLVKRTVDQLEHLWKEEDHGHSEKTADRQP